MDVENSNDGHGGGRPPGTFAALGSSIGAPMCTEDSGNLSTCFFDDADDECFQEALTPTGVHSKMKFPFNNFSMKYVGQKTQDMGDDMETEHSARMTYLEAPDLTEFENSQSIDGTVFQRYQQHTESNKPVDISAELTQALSSGKGVGGIEVVVASPSASIPIPSSSNLPAQYQNSKILTSYYAQMDAHDKSGNSSLSSSPVRSVKGASVSPSASPQPERKIIKSKVKNRDVNVWAPGTM